MGDASEHKERGNALYKDGDIPGALKEYSAALSNVTKDSDKHLYVALHKNLAACHLKQKQYDKVVDHCTKALEVNPADVKALFRRSQAKEAQGNMEDAFTDMAKASQFEPKNAAFAKEANRLMQFVAKKLDQKRSTAGVSSDMIDMALTGDTEDKRKTALKNCIALSNEPVGADKLFLQGAARRLLPLLSNPDEEYVELTLHVLANLAEGHLQRAVGIFSSVTSPEAQPVIKSIITSKTVKLVRAVVRLHHTMLDGLATTENCPPDLADAVAKAKDAVISQLIRFVSMRNVIAEGRDAAIAAIVKQAKNGDVGERLLALGAVRSLLVTAALSKSPLSDVAGQGNVSVSVETSTNTRGEIAVALQQIHEATKQKGQTHPAFLEDCKAQIRFGDTPEGNIPAANALIAVMIAVVDVGNQILEEHDGYQKLLGMAGSDNLNAQCIAVEAISHAASDRKRTRGLMMEGFPVLKRLYNKDLPDAIRVRALCGLCKMSGVSGGAPNLRSFSEGSLINLAKKLRPFLTSSQYGHDVRRWAAEGIAYLSLDADVKELVIEDDDVLEAVRTVCIGKDPSLQYPLANMLVNLTNSYDTPEVTEEQEALKKLGKFAGENIPEPHEKDADDFVVKRTEKLVEANFVTALVELAKSESHGVREEVSRVLLAMTEDHKHRGKIIAQGGAKALLPLAREGTDKGKVKASQALAKLAITSNPAIAFPGQRAAELVKPLVNLTRERKGLLQFEACMALCNLASMSDEIRLKILREKGISRLEDLMFDEDVLVRRAAIEALVNCLYTEKIFDMFATKEGASWSRIKLWTLFSGVEQEEFDLPLCKAASGGLALLSSSPDVCRRIKEEKQGVQILKELLVSGDPDLQHRGLHIVRNMVETDKELAEPFVEKEFLMIMSALFLTSSNETVKNYVQQVLSKLQQYELISSTNDVIREAHQTAFELSQVREKFREQAKQNEDDDDEEDGEEEGDEMVEEIDMDKPASDETTQSAKSAPTDTSNDAKHDSDQRSTRELGPRIVEILDDEHSSEQQEASTA